MTVRSYLSWRLRTTLVICAGAAALAQGCTGDMITETFDGEPAAEARESDLGNDDTLGSPDAAAQSFREAGTESGGGGTSEGTAGGADTGTPDPGSSPKTGGKGTGTDTDPGGTDPGDSSEAGGDEGSSGTDTGTGSGSSSGGSSGGKK
jgi:hypothetical protein